MNIDANGRNGRKSRGEIRIQKPQSVMKKMAVATAKKKRAFVVVCRCRHAMRSTTIISGTKSSRGVHTMSGERVTRDQLVEAERAVDEVAPRAARDKVRRR